MLLRLMDYMKSLQITAYLISLSHSGSAIEQSEVAISSLIDTWLFVRDIEFAGERNRGLYILKSRGMAHSNQVREFVLGRHGVELLDVYLGPSGVLTGSARLVQENKEKAEAKASEREFDRTHAETVAKRKVLEAQLEALRAQITAQDHAIAQLDLERRAHESSGQLQRRAMAISRKADASTGKNGGSAK
jgi:circadian clock protein KaiC